MRVVALHSIKGGVGKTAAAVNLAYLAAHSGLRTLLCDLDPQGAATFYFRVVPRVKGGAKRLVRGKVRIDERVRATDFEGLDLLPADFSYRHLDIRIDESPDGERRIWKLLRPIKNDYDLVVLDCPAGVSRLAESVVRAANAVLSPIIPTTLSLASYDRLERHVRANCGRRCALMPFFSMADRRRKLHAQIMDEWRPQKGALLSSAIPYASAVERMGVERAPLAVFAARSRAALAYRELWREVEYRVISAKGTPA